MVNINNFYVWFIELLIYCLMLIELMLIVSIDELYWNWLNYVLLLRCVDLGMKLIMWLLCELLLRSGELKVIMNDLFGIWLICVVVEIVEDDELRNEILNDVDDERLSWDIEIVEIKICWIWLNWWTMWIACVWW